MDSLTVQVQAERIAASAIPTGPGHPKLESDAEKTAVLLAALADGNYRVTACRMAGISESTLARVYKRAESGDAAASALVAAIERTEAAAEAGIVQKWRKAIDSGPQYWAAAATFLERKAPDRWGKRQDDTSTPKVVVQIGTGHGDVQVHVSAGDAAAPNIIEPHSTPIDVTPTQTATYAETTHVTECALSDAATGRIKAGTSKRPTKKTGLTGGQRRGNRAGGSRR